MDVSNILYYEMYRQQITDIRRLKLDKKAYNLELEYLTIIEEDEKDIQLHRMTSNKTVSMAFNFLDRVFTNGLNDGISFIVDNYGDDSWIIKNVYDVIRKVYKQLLDKEVYKIVLDLYKILSTYWDTVGEEKDSDVSIPIDYLKDVCSYENNVDSYYSAVFKYFELPYNLEVPTEYLELLVDQYEKSKTFKEGQLVRIAGYPKPIRIGKVDFSNLRDIDIRMFSAQTLTRRTKVTMDCSKDIPVVSLRRLTNGDILGVTVIKEESLDMRRVLVTNIQQILDLNLDNYKLNGILHTISAEVTENELSSKIYLDIYEGYVECDFGCNSVGVEIGDDVIIYPLAECTIVNEDTVGSWKEWFGPNPPSDLQEYIDSRNLKFKTDEEQPVLENIEEVAATEVKSQEGAMVSDIETAIDIASTSKNLEMAIKHSIVLHGRFKPFCLFDGDYNGKGLCYENVAVVEEGDLTLIFLNGCSKPEMANLSELLDEPELYTCSLRELASMYGLIEDEDNSTESVLSEIDNLLLVLPELKESKEIGFKFLVAYLAANKLLSGNIEIYRSNRDDATVFNGVGLKYEQGIVKIYTMCNIVGHEVDNYESALAGTEFDGMTIDAVLDSIGFKGSNVTII